ncbi:MAG: polymer-forming cytoskeletal protein [Methanomassiliicoccaceae archaeon]|nr:polymer-forming cytoskeletal protein [Methanomassiliicoccaceae archaeon]
MSRSDKTKSAVVAIAVLSAIGFVALFEFPDDAYAAATGNITFDLNGGSIDGQSSFVKTMGELNATGLPGVSGSTIPSGKNAFVVWSESPTVYSKLYNPGDPAPPNVTKLYAVWGSYTATSGSINVTGTGCYIINGATNLSVSVSASSAPLLVLNNSTLSSLTPKNSTNVTILLHNENQIASMNIQGSNQTIRLSSASTGDVNIVSNSIWGISSFIIDGGNLQIGQISTGGSVILNGGTVNTGGKVKGSSVEVNEGAVLHCKEIDIEGTLIIKGTVYSQGKIQGKPITINEGAVLHCEYIYTAGTLIIEGTVDSQGQVQGSSITISERAVLECGNIYTAGTLIIEGTVYSEGMVQGSSITINGTLESGIIYTGGELTIDGNVTVAGNIQGSTIYIEGGTVVAGSATPSPTIDGNAVVVIGGVDIVKPPESGWKYIKIVPSPSFTTGGISGISVTFKVTVGSETQYTTTTLSLTKLNDRINLSPGSVLLTDCIEVRYFLDGVEYISVGTAVFTPTTGGSGYYTVTIGEGVPANLQYSTIQCSKVEVKVSN